MWLVRCGADTRAISFEPCSCRALPLGLLIAKQVTTSRSVHSPASRRCEQSWVRRSFLVRPRGLLGGRRCRAIDYCGTFTSWSSTIALNLLLGTDGSRPTAVAWPSCSGARGRAGFTPGVVRRRARRLTGAYVYVYVRTRWYRLHQAQHILDTSPRKDLNPTLTPSSRRHGIGKKSSMWSELNDGGLEILLAVPDAMSVS
jgi:hypothetical protein